MRIVAPAEAAKSRRKKALRLDWSARARSAAPLTGLYNLQWPGEGLEKVVSRREGRMTGQLQIQTVVSAPFEENTYVVWRQGRTEALVIDPGMEPDLILEVLEENALAPVAILNTHGHPDHIAGNAALKATFPQAILIAGVHEERLLVDASANLSAAFGMPITSPPADRLVREGEVLDLAGIELAVLEIPGHSPGHIVFVVQGQPAVVFGGDVLFRGSIGRTDFPGGDFDTLAAGIRGKLYTLADQTVVYPGHGPTTTVGLEKRENPFVSG
jgi:glyoxylase-like metal-dependent hydrolase (beta-lactamase superfamily II)